MAKIGHISQEFLYFLENIFKILIFLEELYNSREIPGEFIKKPENGLNGELLEMQRRG